MLPNILIRSFKQCYNLNEKSNEVDKKTSHDGFALNMTFKEFIHVVGGCIKYFLTKISYMPLGYLPIVTLSFVSYLVVCLR